MKSPSKPRKLRYTSGLSVSMAELKILTILTKNEKGYFGSEIAHNSGIFIDRGTVYTVLNRLVAKRFVEFVVVPSSPGHNMDRPKYMITGLGIKAIVEFAAEFGFEWKM